MARVRLFDECDVLDETFSGDVCGKLLPVAEIQFVEDILDVDFHRMGRQEELVGNLLVCGPPCYHGGNLLLTPGEGDIAGWPVRVNVLGETKAVLTRYDHRALRQQLERVQEPIRRIITAETPERTGLKSLLYERRLALRAGKHDHRATFLHKALDCAHVLSTKATIYHHDVRVGLGYSLIDALDTGCHSSYDVASFLEDADYALGLEGVRATYDDRQRSFHACSLRDCSTVAR